MSQEIMHDSERMVFTKANNSEVIITVSEDYEDAPTDIATIRRVNARALVAAIRAEMGWDVDPEMSPTVEAAAEQINGGELKVDGLAEPRPEPGPDPSMTFEEALAREGREAGTPTVQDALTAASTAQAQADAALRKAEEVRETVEASTAHEHLSDYWERRLDVVEKALAMLPAPAKRGGVLEALTGVDAEQPERVEKALKIARFATEDIRDIPGVDA